MIEKRRNRTASTITANHVSLIRTEVKTLKLSKSSIASGVTMGVVAITLIALSPLPTMAAELIDGGDIANNSVASRDLKNNNVKSKDIKDGTIKSNDLDPALTLKGVPVPGPAGENGKDGATGPAGVAGAKGATGATGPAGADGKDGAPFTYVGVNWSLVDRNTIGSPVAALRAGPASGLSVRPPLGIGSLGITVALLADGPDSNTDADAEKVAFGNQVDYVGDPLADINTVRYDVFTTGENRASNVANLPGISFEVDPTGPATSGPGNNYSTLVYVPVEAPANVWSTQDGSTADQWFLTGAAGTASGCNQAPTAGNPNGYCTLAEVKAVFPDATLLTTQITKGRDFAFSGAVDKLVINSSTFDFEPNGVFESN